MPTVPRGSVVIRNRPDPHMTAKYTGTMSAAERLWPQEPREITPGAVHVPNWLSIAQQRDLVQAAREWGKGPVPFHAPAVRSGVMSVQLLCLGLHWLPYRYSQTADNVNGEPVLDLPDWLVRLGQQAVGTAQTFCTSSDGFLSRFNPDTALVNYYPPGAKMGMHQDREEQSMSPVVSLSIGDTCQFRFGNPESRGRPYQDIELESGDLFVFGGVSRLAYHGVPKVFPHTAPPDCGLARGRISITLRETGLTFES